MFRRHYLNQVLYNIRIILLNCC
uniref:Uncharacterized protein n=1 Tax=Anguilla anguilla TaxID=7936 RepID=A0A0E9VXT1_ANGAN